MLCNCDNPEWSNFFVFFRNHFRQLKMKKLITTHYNKDGSPSYKIEWEGEMLNDDMLNLIKTPLKGNGDFRSEECIEILKEADIVVTNPPFSLYREYIAQLIEYKKQFVILGNPNSIAYKEVFPLLKDGKMFIGYKPPSGGMWFYVRDKVVEPIKNGIIKTTWKLDKKGRVIVNCPGIWFTNLDLDKTHEPLILTKNYYGNESRYPKYDNYDAIECGKVKDIPKDYFPCWYKCPQAAQCIYAQTEGKEDKALCEMAGKGEVGVPITYLAWHCEEQFDIIASSEEVARPMKEVDADGIYEKGGPAFYIENVDNDERKQRAAEAVQTVVSQNRHSQEVASVMESSESQLHSLRNSARNSSELSDREQEIRQKNSESEETIEGERTFPSQETEWLHVHTTEFSFNDCRKCNGVIGVPITYLAEHCMEQFEIVGTISAPSEQGTLNLGKDYSKYIGYTQDRHPNGRTGSTFGKCPVIEMDDKKHPYYEKDGVRIQTTYHRIFIKRKI